MVEIKGSDFKDNKVFGDKILKQSLTTIDGETVKIRVVMWFSYRESEEMDFASGEVVSVSHEKEVWCRYSLNDLGPWKKVFLSKRKLPANVTSVVSYREPVPLKSAKCKDPMALVKKGLLDERTSCFYIGLCQEQGQYDAMVVDDVSDPEDYAD